MPATKAGIYCLGKAMCSYFSHLQSQPMHFHMRAAMAAPAKGPTINIHNCSRAAPPWKIAGPIERAGFTDVPV